MISALTYCKSESLQAFLSRAEIAENSREEASEAWCFLGEQQNW